MGRGCSGLGRCVRGGRWAATAARGGVGAPVGGNGQGGRRRRGRDADATRVVVRAPACVGAGLGSARSATAGRREERLALAWGWEGAGGRPSGRRRRGTHGAVRREGERESVCGRRGREQKNNSLALTPSIARARSATRPCGGWPHAHPSQWPPLPAPRPGRRARPHPRPGRRLHRPRMRGRGVAANRAGRPRPAPRPGQVNEMRGGIPLILNWEAGVDATHAGASSRARRAPPCPATRCPIKPRNSKRAPFFFSCLPIHRPRLFRLPPPALPLPDRLHAGPVRCPGKGRGGAV